MTEPAEHDKQKAMELAEESREAEWKHPSFVAELFNGNFRWDLIHPFPEQDPEDKRVGDEFIERLRVALERYIDPNEADRTGEIPEEALLALAEIGCFGLKIPKEYGGLGMSQTNYNRVMTYLASYCNSTAVWLSAHQSIGTPEPLRLFGTPEQKAKYLPRLAKGAVSGFALTEPDVGSDPARMKTTATPSEDGSHYILNGEKLWCTNGPKAELLVVMALTPPKMVKGKEKPQITAFIVETDAPGFEVAHLCSFMGIRGISNGLLRFRNVRVPAESIIGKPGEGLKIALMTLNTGRLTLPATAAACGKLGVHFSRDWCTRRVQWGVPIGKHQSIGLFNADMAADTFAMECMNAAACAMVDRGGADIRLEAAMAKYYCTETAWRIADDLLQVRGGRGFETAESLVERGEEPVPVERMLRDARIGRIIEGTSQIMYLFIAREAMDAHMSRVMPILLRKGPRGRLLWEATKFYAKWYPKQWLPPSAPSDVRNLSQANRNHLAYIARTSKRLARTMFHVMARYQQRLEREQILLRAFVDIGTDLFAMASVLARTEQLLAQNENDPKRVQLLADYFCARARRRIAGSFRTVKQRPGRLVDQVASSFLEGSYEWLAEGVYTGFPPTFLSAEKMSRLQAETAEVAAETPQTEMAGQETEGPLDQEAPKQQIPK